MHGVYIAAATGSFLGRLHTQTEPPGRTPPIDRYRFVFLVDTSGSMMGLGDGKAIIFPKVQAELVRFLRTLPASEVVFVPFHQGPQGSVASACPMS